jgi:hypothetical protein
MPPQESYTELGGVGAAVAHQVSPPGGGFSEMEGAQQVSPPREGFAEMAAGQQQHESPRSAAQELHEARLRTNSTLVDGSVPQGRRNGGGMEDIYEV